MAGIPYLHSGINVTTTSCELGTALTAMKMPRLVVIKAKSGVSQCLQVLGRKGSHNEWGERGLAGMRLTLRGLPFDGSSRLSKGTCRVSKFAQKTRKFVSIRTKPEGSI